jgi:hypothetical protein
MTWKLTSNPGVAVTASKDIQVALPQLFVAGSQGHFDLIRQWAATCDGNATHPTCNSAARAEEKKRIPTRLIDVGTTGDDMVHLWETKPGDSAEYVALSHPWGKSPHFCMYRTNIEEEKRGIELSAIKRGIHQTSIPDTFLDAIITTRALGQRYLWIDSICIDQGEDGDFSDEAKHMEAVFRQAYCVIAASCSTGHFSGFLHPRKERKFVQFTGPNNEPFYICDNVDDFEEHVIKGALNKRGWVLQEHALARRTIFFTEHQTYWECGQRVRCETMGKMSK